MNERKIEWLGQIPEKWLIRRIKYVFQLRDERSYEALENVNLISVYTDKGVLQRADFECATGNKATNADGYKIVYKNDVVVNIMLCWMGAIGISDYEGVTSPAYDVYKIRSEDSINPKFYNYLFRTSMFSNECYRRGKGIMAMRWRVYSDQFTDILIPVPPKEIQNNIVKYLDIHCKQIDVFIEKKTKEIELLEELKKAIITESVLGRLDNKRKLKDSGVQWLGMIPEEWKTIKGSSLFFENKKTNKLRTEKKLLQFKYGTIVPKPIQDFDKDDKGIYNKYLIVKPNQIMINGLNLNFDLVSQRTGKVLENGIITSAYICLEFRNEKEVPYYHYVLKYLDSIKFFHTLGTGIRQTLSFDEIKNLQLPWPSELERKEIAVFLDKKCSEIDTMISNIQKEIDSIKDLKKRLICDAVTGKIAI